MIQSECVRVNCSCLAALTGQNPYMKRADGLLATWRSSDPKGYKEAHARVNLETPEDKKTRIKNAYPMIESLARTTKPSVMSSSLATMGASMFLPDREYSGSPATMVSAHISRADIVAVAREATNTFHGIDRERVILDRVNEIMDTMFHQDDTLYSKTVGTTEKGGRPVIVQGRVDAIRPNAVLEIKTRTRGLFMDLKGYERVQMDAYMFLTDRPRAYLAEAFFPSKQATDPDLNMITVDRDEDRMQDTCSKALDMARVLDTLFESPELQKSFLRSSNRDRWIAHALDGHL